MLTYNNYIISNRNNQDFYEYCYIIINWLLGSKIVLKDLEHLLVRYRFTDNKRKILEVLIRYTGIYHETYISQFLIAKLSGVHHDTVNKALKLFAALGLIKKKNRGPNRTCVYSLGSMFHDPKFKWAVKDIFPSLHWATSSIIRRCKSMLSNIISPLVSVFNQNTARLSNDKNKDINTIKKRFEYTRKESEKERIDNLSEQDQIALDKYLEKEKKERDLKHLEYLELIKSYGFII